MQRQLACNTEPVVINAPPFFTFTIVEAITLPEELSALRLLLRDAIALIEGKGAPLVFGIVGARDSGQEVVEKRKAGLAFVIRLFTG
jgi:hypothetical protein